MPIEPRLNAHPRNQVGPLVNRPAAGTQDGQIYTSQFGMTAWDAEAGLWRGAASGGGSVYTTYTLNPDADPSFPGSYTTWAALYADYVNGTGPCTIYVHDSATIPAGVYLIRNFTQFEGIANVATTLTFDDGASFVTTSSFQFQRCSVASNSSSPIFVFVPDLDVGVSAIIMDQGANLISNGTSPILVWDEPSAGGKFLIMAMLLGAQIQNPGLGAGGTIRIQGAGADNPSVLFFLGETSTIGTDSISSNANATAILQAAVNTSSVGTQANYLGAGTPFINPFITEQINTDVNGFRTFNLGAPQAPNDAARLVDVAQPLGQIALGNGLPNGLTSTPGFAFDVGSGTFSHVVPANPHYFVASTGNNANAGTVGSPLATVAEALRRLLISSWSGQPIATVVDSINEGADPTWNVPQPPAGASPILIQGTFVDSGLGVVAPTTGGAAGNEFTPALATVTSAAVAIVNAFRGMFLRFTAGPLVNTRHVIDSNTVTPATFVLGGVCSAAPVAADTFVVENVPTITVTGTLRIICADGVLLDGLDFALPTRLVLVGTLQYTACRFRATGGGVCSIEPQQGSEFRGTATGLIAADPVFPIPAGVIPSGSRFDGSGAIGLRIGGTTIGGALIFESSSFQTTTFVTGNTPVSIGFSSLCSLHGGTLNLSSSELTCFSTLFDAMLDVGLGAAINLTLGCMANFAWIQTTGTPGGKNLIQADQSSLTIDTWIGANAGAGVPLVVTRHSSVRLPSQPAVTGGAPGVSDVKVGGNAATTWLLAFGGFTANSTDVAAASSQLCRVGP